MVGLMFIAITFGAKLVTPETVAITRSVLSPIIHHFAQAFLIACSALVPESTATVFGSTVVLTGMVRLVQIPSLRAMLHKMHRERGDIETSDWILSVILPTVLYLALIVSGGALLCGEPWSYMGIALAVTALLILGVLSAWDTLVWIATQV
jgi:hypothetical protein